MKFLDLPSRTSADVRARPDELQRRGPRACSSRTAGGARRLGSLGGPRCLRDYIRGSRGEFTVAKDQNVRLRSGWFSDRSATYLAAGRPWSRRTPASATCCRPARAPPRGGGGGWSDYARSGAGASAAEFDITRWNSRHTAQNVRRRVMPPSSNLPVGGPSFVMHQESVPRTTPRPAALELHDLDASPCVVGDGAPAVAAWLRRRGRRPRRRRWRCGRRRAERSGSADRFETELVKLVQPASRVLVIGRDTWPCRSPPRVGSWRWRRTSPTRPAAAPRRSRTASSSAIRALNLNARSTARSSTPSSRSVHRARAIQSGC